MRIEYARRLEKVESLKAEERMKYGKSDPVEKSPQGGKTGDIVAEKVGIGSSNTYRKEKYLKIYFLIANTKVKDNLILRW